MTRPDDEFPPLDVTSTLHLGALDDVLDGPGGVEVVAGVEPRLVESTLARVRA